jgi:hypothetical protein
MTDEQMVILDGIEMGYDRLPIKCFLYDGVTQVVPTDFLHPRFPLYSYTYTNNYIYARVHCRLMERDM